MATFTMTLAEIFGDQDIETASDAIQRADLLGLDLYPIFDEAYRDALNEKIIRRYWNREIAHETVDMFKFRMFAVMNELMPWYNDMLKSTQLKFDPMMTMDLKTIADNHTTNTNVDRATGTSSDTINTERSESGTDLGSNTSDTGSRTVNSITPQNQLSGNGDYADSMADTTTEGRNTSNASRTGEGEEKSDTSGTTTAEQEGESEQNIKLDTRTSGYQAVPADLLRKYRDTIINVDVMLLDKLSTLFMIITTNGDEYFHSRPQHMTQGFFLGGYY